MQSNGQAMQGEESYPRIGGRAVLHRVHVVASGLLILWGLGWAVFAVAASLSGEDAEPWHGLAAVAILAAFVGAAVWHPRFGGIALILGGLFAAEFFDHPFAALGLAGPAVLLGVVHVLLGVMRPSKGS